MESSRPFSPHETAEGVRGASLHAHLNPASTASLQPAKRTHDRKRPRPKTKDDAPDSGGSSLDGGTRRRSQRLSVGALLRGRVAIAACATRNFSAAVAAELKSNDCSIARDSPPTAMTECNSTTPVSDRVAPPSPPPVTSEEKDQKSRAPAGVALPTHLRDPISVLDGASNVAVSISSAERPPYSTASTVGTFPLGGGSSGASGRRRSRSRLSLNKSRPSTVPQKGGSSIATGSRIPHPEAEPHGYPWGSSFQRQPRRVSSAASLASATVPERGSNEHKTRAGYPLSELSRGISGPASSNVNAAGEGVGGMLPSPPRRSPPPFVGLDNLGETCYVNAVVQALLACSETMACVGACVGGGGPVAETAGSHERLSSLPLDRDVPAMCPWASSGGFTPSASVSESTIVPGSAAGLEGLQGSHVERRNPVLDALGSLLEKMKRRNRSGNFPDGTGGTRSQAVTPQVFAEATVASEDSVFAAGAAQEISVAPPSELRQEVCETPPCRSSLPPGSTDLCPAAIRPITLVTLIRDGWLNAELLVGGSGNFRNGMNGGFGGGQQCVSELLGRLLSLDDPTGPEARGGASARCDDRGCSTLGAGFRGALCARTLCMECERDRVSREHFAELTLPPLLLPLSLPVANNSGEQQLLAQQASLSTPPRTLQRLVEMTLGRESLGGRNKVWCEACRQWTEAERLFSLHLSPRLLALHIRPAKGGCGYSPSPQQQHPVAGHDSGGVFSGRDPYKATGCAEDGSKVALIERVLTIKGAARCQFHEPAAAAAARASATTSLRNSSGVGILRDKGLPQPLRDDSNDEETSTESKSKDHVYDLIGIILHQGQTLGSGHYTFALDASSAANKPRRSSPCPSAPNPKAGGAEFAGSPRKEERTKFKRHTASGGAAAGRRGELEKGDNALWQDQGKMVLFDDACVRWLSIDEEETVLRGGGEGGGLGDAFLVFYARRALG